MYHGFGLAYLEVGSSKHHHDMEVPVMKILHKAFLCDLVELSMVNFDVVIGID